MNVTSIIHQLRQESFQLRGQSANTDRDDELVKHIQLDKHSTDKELMLASRLDHALDEIENLNDLLDTAEKDLKAANEVIDFLNGNKGINFFENTIAKVTTAKSAKMIAIGWVSGFKDKVEALK